MAQAVNLAVRPLVMTGLEATLFGLAAGGCRLAFVPPTAYQMRGAEVSRFARRMARAKGLVVQAQSDSAAVAMAAGAALRGARAVALVSDGAAADCALSGLDDLPAALVDVSGRLPLGLSHVRATVAPHTVQSAFEAGAGLFAQSAALHGPGLIAGLTPGTEAGLVSPNGLRPNETGLGPVPIHHDGPDDADLLLVGAGPGFEACADAREALEAQGVEAAHLHLLQVSPFPGAIVAPAITSARRVLVVEPGGPGTLAGWIRSHLGFPTAPFAELPRLGDTPLDAEQVVRRALEVMAL
jgi:hypothetical protein